MYLFLVVLFFFFFFLVSRLYNASSSWVGLGALGLAVCASFHQTSFVPLNRCCYLYSGETI
jgi:hypothetical protein